MKKRLKKKKENNYNALNHAKRQSYKRKGYRCLRYELLLIGPNDKQALDSDKATPDYPLATHWLIEAYAWRHSSQVIIYPCVQNGGTSSKAPLQMFIFDGNNANAVLHEFERAVDDIKKDSFWEAD